MRATLGTCVEQTLGLAINQLRLETGSTQHEAEYSPYAKWEGMTSLRVSFTVMPTSPRSHPFMTWPWPSGNLRTP